jgi:large subunit ribosomal protein L18
MADKNKVKAKRLESRKYSTRVGLFGMPARPGLRVFRCDKHIYAQLIDDLAGRTLAAAASTDAAVRGAELKNGGNLVAARKVGLAIAAKAKEAGITAAAFDRGGRRYHGRVKALADAARKGGLKF